MKIETNLDGAVVAAIERHYEHAKEKHPYFCDSIVGNPNTVAILRLHNLRANLRGEIKMGDVSAHTVALCEMAEMEEALTRGDTAAAVEECYDVIAVLLRAIDVLEGRQSLGRPEKGGAPCGSTR